MDKPDSLKVFHTLPMSIDRHPYLEWSEDLRLKRYLQRLITDNTLAPTVTAIAQTIVAKLERLPPARGKYSQLERDLCGCATALLAGILLSRHRGNWIKADLFEKVQKYGSTLELGDIYAIGLQILSDPQWLMHGFAPAPNLVWFDLLRAYSQTKFQRSLVDGIRKLPGLKHFKRTNLGMLVRTSAGRVTDALIAGGERGERLETMVLLHQYLKETVTANKFETKNPQLVHYQELFARSRIQAGGAHPISDLDKLKELLTAMGNTLRNYEQPQIDSIDRPVGSEDTDRAFLVGDSIAINATAADPRLGDLLPDELSSIETLVERQNLRQQVVELLTQLSGDRSRILMFLYGLALNQTAAGLELGCNQTNISRRRDRLLLELTRQLYQQLALGELTAELLATLVKSLKDICEDYYAELLVGILTEIDAPSSSEEICQEFIDRVQIRWQFTFHPDRRGAIVAEEFVRLRSHLLL